VTGPGQAGARASVTATQDPDVPAGGHAGGWHAVTATKRGAAHRAAGIPNQDAAEVLALEQGGLVAAVADGHGHHRHFRSARGARLAVSIAGQVARDLAARPGGLPGPAEAAEELRRVLVPAIVTRWRHEVRRDVLAGPFTEAEEAVRRGDDETIPYGTTLLVAIGMEERLLLAQIGDGDIVCVRPDGTALLPVPGDPLLDGRHTTSLCSPGAGDSFRAAAVDLAGTPLLGAFLATDGYGNAQVAQVWESVASAELAGLMTAPPPSRLPARLAAWAAECASVDGSADDTTLALLVTPAGTAPAR
jgi:Protein phosphatase 2C